MNVGQLHVGTVSAVESGTPCLGRNSSGKDLEVILLQTRNELPLHAVAQEEKQSLKNISSREGV